MRSDRHRPRGDDGTATAELAACLPVLVLVLSVVLAAVTVAGARVRAADAAREAVRAAARNDPARARTLADAAAPHAEITLRHSGRMVIADVRLHVHFGADWLPSVTITERAVAAAEPTVGRGP